MKVQVQPQTFLVSCMSGNQTAGFRIESGATALLLAQVQIQLDRFQHISALRPYLKLGVVGGNEDVCVFVRFRCFREADLIYSTVMDHRLFDSIIFDPDEAVDLRPYQRGNRLIGNWKITAETALVPYSVLAGLNEESFRGFRTALPYRTLHSWPIEFFVPRTGVEITPMGRLAEDFRDTGASFDVDDL